MMDSQLTEVKNQIKILAWYDNEGLMLVGFRSSWNCKWKDEKNMEFSNGLKLLGAIVCKYCGEVIDTIDAEKVETHYSECKKEQCLKQVNED